MKVIITGASRGIGKAIALKLQDTYSLVLHASRDENLETLWNELKNNKNHEKLCADFSNAEELKNFCRAIKKNYSKDLYCVINNAGITIDKALMYQPEDEIDRMLQLNLKAPIMISKAAFKVFHSKKKGIIINISSVIGELGNAFQSVYAATKAGLTGFTKSLAREAGELSETNNLRIISVSLGYIETGMTKKIPESFKAKYKSHIPLKRFGQASEVAGVIAFLLSDEASYINGSDIKINGGII
ncbi:MAG: SDR family oxidoreductase [Ginsengibacter sp.]